MKQEFQEWNSKKIEFNLQKNTSLLQHGRRDVMWTHSISFIGHPLGLFLSWICNERLIKLTCLKALFYINIKAKKKMKGSYRVSTLDVAVRLFIHYDYSASFYFENIDEAVFMWYLANEQKL